VIGLVDRGSGSHPCRIRDFDAGERTSSMIPSTTPKVWFITGASRGLGRELARAVLAAGHRVAATARKPEDVADLVASAPGRAVALRLDVTEPAEAAAALAAARERLGGLDVVVNNAGYANVGSVEDLAPDDFRAQVDTDFFGVVNVTRAAIPFLRAQRSGHVIQVSSIGGRMATPGLAAYQASKWAVGGFSEVVAQEVAPFGVKVTIVEPGGMRTDWAGSSMRVDPVTPAYEATIGLFQKHIRENQQGAQTDPAKAARAILEVAAVPDPPLHLLLGSDAVFLAGVVAATRAAEDARWQALSRSTDFDGLGDFKDTPVAKMLLEPRR
jgi:NAD(P)-dependent dehydrogenase (short-subunit alcohol dehydrogenase family)